MSEPYPPDTISDNDDDGTMPENVATLAEQVVGRRIVHAEQGSVKAADTDAVGNTYNSRHDSQRTGLILTLDDGRRVILEDSSDCCAFTSLDKFLLHPDRVDHIITGVATTDGYEKWHIYADLGDVMELDVSWSCGNPFYYGYGFDIFVSNVIDGSVVEGGRQLTDGKETP